jgi:hypothetical protein
MNQTITHVFHQVDIIPKKGVLRVISPLVAGPTPIPGFYTELLYSNVTMEFLWTSRRKGYKESTIVQNYAQFLRHLAKHCSITDSNGVLDYLARRHVSNARKELIILDMAAHAETINWLIEEIRKLRRTQKPPIQSDFSKISGTL